MRQLPTLLFRFTNCPIHLHYYLYLFHYDLDMICDELLRFLLPIGGLVTTDVRLQPVPALRYNTLRLRRNDKFRP